jgi:hypothetical protein
MKLVRPSVVLFAVSIGATGVFAQLPKFAAVSTSATQTTRKQVKDEPNPKITLRVDDFAHLDPVVLAGARQVTTEIFRKAGVETVWLDCAVYQTDCGQKTERPQFMLRILAPSMEKAINVDEALGFAMPCDDDANTCLFYIFYSRISALTEAHAVGSHRLLGHVMAHEIGHTLLGRNAHDLYGIMQASLPLGNVEQTLFFTSVQAKRLQTELLARNRATGR